MRFHEGGAKERMRKSRRDSELSNEHLLAKTGVDTAENEPLKVWRKVQFIIHSPPYSSVEFVCSSGCTVA